MNILAIDPGNKESAYVLCNDSGIIEFNKELNESLIKSIYFTLDVDCIVVEMVASYGMPVGKDVFDTCVWIGRFLEASENESIKTELIYRKEVKMNLCQSTRAKDSNIIQALVDRFANTSEHGKYGKGTKKNKGYFYGFSKDVWQAYAVAVTYYDKIKNN
jgi:hypothetical protein